MTWNKKAGSKISKEKGKEMVEKYQKKHKDGVKAVYFDSEVFKDLIEVPNAAGISIQFALNEKGEDTVVLYPVDPDGKIIYSPSDAKGSEPVIYNLGNPCPPYCTS